MRFVLVHGYSGSSGDLRPLAEALDALFGPGSAALVALHPQWTGGAPPAFDETAFTAAIRAAVEGPGPVTVVGHSTGGSLALLALQGLDPALLVLLATPPTVEPAHLDRFMAATRPGNEPPGLLDIARMVRAILAAGRQGLPQATPVLILHGDADPLVPPGDLRHWTLPAGARTVLVPGAAHDLAGGAALGPVLDAIVDALLPVPALTPAATARLRKLEPRVAAFADATDGGWRALARTPAARRAVAPATPLPPDLGLLAPAPTLANIELTARCPHTCPSCARSFLREPREDMTPDQFGAVLAALPQASRITLVGLGEPTLHRELPGLVARAAGQGRSVGLVTSGANLSAALARQLVAAGLGGVTFSLDAAEAALAAELRPGVPFRRTLAAMTGAAEVFRDAVPLAVFTAVCRENARHLDPIAALARALGARAWMLSDLNFAQNSERSLVAGAGDRAAVAGSLARALEAGLPPLDVRGLEELGKPFRLREFLLRPADRLWTRSPGHSYCLSPWQTAAVGADGTLTVCDCQPDQPVGNIFRTPFQELWNGPVLRQLRAELRSGDLRPACRGCPRL